MKGLWLAAVLAVFCSAPRLAHAEMKPLFSKWPVVYVKVQPKSAACVSDYASARAAFQTVDGARLICANGAIKSHTKLKSLFTKWPVVYVHEKTYSCVES